MSFETSITQSNTSTSFHRFYNVLKKNVSYRYLYQDRTTVEFAHDLWEEIGKEYPKLEPFKLRLELWNEEGGYVLTVRRGSDEPRLSFWNVLGKIPPNGKVDIGTFILNANSIVTFARADIVIPKFPQVDIEHSLITNLGNLSVDSQEKLTDDCS